MDELLKKEGKSKNERKIEINQMINDGSVVQKIANGCYRYLCEIVDEVETNAHVSLSLVE